MDHRIFAMDRRIFVYSASKHIQIIRQNFGENLQEQRTNFVEFCLHYFCTILYFNISCFKGHKDYFFMKTTIFLFHRSFLPCLSRGRGILSPNMTLRWGISTPVLTREMFEQPKLQKFKCPGVGMLKFPFDRYINPLSPDINMYILHTVLHMFLMIPLGRIC